MRQNLKKNQPVISTLHLQTLSNIVKSYSTQQTYFWVVRLNSFRQFKRVVNALDLPRVKVLTNMWLQDGKEDTFPAKTPEDNHPPGVRSRLDKDFECEELIKNPKPRKRRISFHPWIVTYRRLFLLLRGNQLWSPWSEFQALLWLTRSCTLPI